jgi:hypothetical protein
MYLLKGLNVLHLSCTEKRDRIIATQPLTLSREMCTFLLKTKTLDKFIIDGVGDQVKYLQFLNKSMIF